MFNPPKNKTKKKEEKKTIANKLRYSNEFRPKLFLEWCQKSNRFNDKNCIFQGTSHWRIWKLGSATAVTTFNEIHYALGFPERWVSTCPKWINCNFLGKKNSLIWFSEDGITKTFQCARTLVGQYVFLQLVGVEGSLSLCEVEVFSTDGKSRLFPSFFFF